MNDKQPANPTLAAHANGGVPLEELGSKLVDTYDANDRMSHLDAEFLPNRQRTIEIIELTRRLMFPGFFDNTRLHLSQYTTVFTNMRQHLPQSTTASTNTQLPLPIHNCLYPSAHRESLHLHLCTRGITRPASDYRTNVEHHLWVLRVVITNPATPRARQPVHHVRTKLNAEHVNLSHHPDQG